MSSLYMSYTSKLGGYIYIYLVNGSGLKYVCSYECRNSLDCYPVDRYIVAS